MNIWSSRRVSYIMEREIKFFSKSFNRCSNVFHSRVKSKLTYNTSTHQECKGEIPWEKGVCLGWINFVIPTYWPKILSLFQTKRQPPKVYHQKDVKGTPWHAIWAGPEKGNGLNKEWDWIRETRGNLAWTMFTASPVYLVV